MQRAVTPVGRVIGGEEPQGLRMHRGMGRQGGWAQSGSTNWHVSDGFVHLKQVVIFEKRCLSAEKANSLCVFVYVLFISIYGISRITYIISHEVVSSSTKIQNVEMKNRLEWCSGNCLLTWFYRKSLCICIERPDSHIRPWRVRARSCSCIYGSTSEILQYPTFWHPLEE